VDLHNWKLIFADHDCNPYFEHIDSAFSFWFSKPMLATPAPDMQFAEQVGRMEFTETEAKLVQQLFEKFGSHIEDLQERDPIVASLNMLSPGREQDENESEDEEDGDPVANFHKRRTFTSSQKLKIRGPSEAPGDSIARPAFCFFILASEIHKPTLPGQRNIVPEAGWGLSYHWIMRIFDTLASKQTRRPFQQRLLREDFPRLVKILLNAAVKSFPCTKSEPEFHKDFFDNRMVSAFKRIDERIARQVQFRRSAKEVYDGLTFKPEDVPSQMWPPLPPGESGVNQKDYESILQKWTEATQAMPKEHFEAVFDHSASVDHGNLVALQLLEPEVFQIVAMYEPIFRALFSSFCNLVVDKDGVAEDNLNDAHMTFESFFRFCSEFEIYPAFASYHLVEHYYSNAELTGAWFEPAKFGWISGAKKKEEAFKGKTGRNARIKTEWMKKSQMEMNDGELYAMKFLASLDKNMSAIFMRVRDLFAAMDTEGKGLIDADLLQKAIYKLEMGDEFEATGMEADDLIRLLDQDQESEAEPTLRFDEIERILLDYRARVNTSPAERFMYKKDEEMTELEKQTFDLLTALASDINERHSTAKGTFTAMKKRVRASIKRMSTHERRTHRESLSDGLNPDQATFAFFYRCRFHEAS
jgi:hypothetical protein